MSDVAIKVENLSKQYRIGGPQEGYRTFRDTVTNAFTSPFHKARDLIRGVHTGAAGLTETIWALKDVSFEVKPGEVVGIIGRNGAGKTTLLKILSRITEPTQGSAEIYGRVGSLLEVGTGFHPELTGRENIHLNGAILGMKKTEIDSKFDEIVAFAEIEKFIDTPVKHYSSGMYVRLAFAVAAHLESEILLVDEVLAVGDATFQRKCLGKMGDVARQGRTVLFVSHNMGAVGRLCNCGILLNGGKVDAIGPIQDVTVKYAEETIRSEAKVRYPQEKNKKSQILSVQLCGHNGKPSVELNRKNSFRVMIEYEIRENICGAHVGLMLDRIDGIPVCHSIDLDTKTELVDRSPGLYRSVVEFPGGFLNASVYQIRLCIAKYGGPVYDYREPFVFSLNDYGTFATVGVHGKQRPGILAIPLRWKTQKA